MSTYIYPPTPAASGGATEATLLLVEQNTSDTVDELQLANASLDAIEATNATIAATDFATEAKQDSQITELQAANASLDAIEASNATIAATDFATEAKQDAQIVEAVATNASLDAIEADVDELNARLPGGFVTDAFDYQAITYVGATTDIDTVVYKSGGAGGTTVATLTMGYDGSNRLTSVTKT